MKSSKQAKRDAKELFRCCLVNSLLDENRARQAVSKVLEAKPRGYVGILNWFQRLVKSHLDRRTARVSSATPLDAAQQNAVQSGLAKRYGQGLILSYAQDPSLIGGMRVQVGYDVYDGSIRGRLNALEQEL